MKERKIVLESNKLFCKIYGEPVAPRIQIKFKKGMDTLIALKGNTGVKTWIRNLQNSRAITLGFNILEIA